MRGPTPPSTIGIGWLGGGICARSSVESQYCLSATSVSPSAATRSRGVAVPSANLASSSGIGPEPRPSSKRPPDASAKVVACLASTAGWRNASHSTRWPSLSRSVLAATHVATVMASQIGLVGAIGVSRLASNAMPAKPAASAACARVTRSASPCRLCGTYRNHSAMRTPEVSIASDRSRVLPILAQGDDNGILKYGECISTARRGWSTVAGRCDGKVALVTGSSRGLGKAIAQRLALEGATVALTARTMDPDPKYAGSLAQTRDEIVASGGQAIAVQADLSSSEDRERLFAEVVESVGSPDILVNNAAVTFLRPLDGFPEKRVRLMLEMHLVGPLHLSQLAIPAMRERGRGWILNLTSVGGDLPPGPPFSEFDTSAGFGIYGTAKAARNRLTKSLAAELYDD